MPPFAHAAVCAVQKISWKMCLGCENMCATVLKAQATMEEAFLTCLEVCLWRISLCLDSRVKLTLTKDTVCIVRNEDKLTQERRQPHPKRGWPNSKIADDIPKKGRQPYPKTEDDLTQKSIFCKFFFKNASNWPKNTSFLYHFWTKINHFL